MLRNIVLDLQYEGTRYNGWQIQGNTDNTIQGKLEALLSKMAGEKIELNASGRTDAGVHAYSQIAGFKTHCEMSCDEMLSYINGYLPRDIAVRKVWEADMRFHARLSAKGKKYTYRIVTGPVPDVFDRRIKTYLQKRPDVSLLRLGAERLTGQHDFKGFSDYRGNKSTVRNISEIRITETGNDIDIEFTGNGFLYHSVRIMVGTLLEIGYKERQLSDIDRVFETKDRKNAGFTAPAEGLRLEEVYY